MHQEDWEEVNDYFSIMKCTECKKFVWFQDDRYDYPDACLICGIVPMSEITCTSIGYAIAGESYFYIDEEIVHENDISLELFESL